VRAHRVVQHIIGARGIHGPVHVRISRRSLAFSCDS
jgi:hypothetical protein